MARSKPKGVLITAKTVRGNRVALPPGARPKGTDDQGRLLYQSPSGNEYYTLQRVPSGWIVSTYAGSCGCG